MLRIQCLGQLSVQRDGEPLSGSPAQPKRLAILALLACAGNRGITRDKLIGLLWPDTDTERARRLVSQAICALRRDMADEAIEGQRELRFNPDQVTSDIDEFRAAVAAGSFCHAATLYGGPFLEGFDLSGAPEFDRWLDNERAGLMHTYADVLEKCAMAEVAQGNQAAAVTWWRRLAAEDPTNARVAIQLMRALGAAGDRSGAIRHAEIHGLLMKQELDLPPDATVEAYAQELRVAHTPMPNVIFEPIETRQPPTTTAPAADQVVSTKEPPATARRGLRPHWMFIAPLVLAALVALFVVVRRAPDVIDTRRVAVLPLDNRSGDSTLDPVGLMVAEWVTNGLLSTGLVTVVDARTMLDLVRSEAAAGSQSLRSIVQRTGAGLLVSGSYYHEHDTLLFRLEITNARSGNLVRSIDPLEVPVARPTEALEPLRQRVTGALAVLLDNRLNNWTAVTSQPPTFEAYQEFLIGMDLFGTDYRTAIRHFDRATTYDPTYRQAMLWAGVSYSNLREYPPADSLFTILSQHRTQLAPYDQANLEYFYGGFVLGDWERSYHGARRMAQLAPAAAHALFALGLTAVITSRSGEAVDLLTRIDTETGWGKDWSLRIWNVLTWGNHQLGRHNAELQIARRMRQHEPDAGWTRLHEIRALIALGRIRESLLRADEATAFPRTSNTWEPFSPGDLLYQTGRELRAHGNPEPAADLFQRAEQWFATQTSEPGARQSRADAVYALERWDDAAAIYDSLLRLDTTNVVLLGSLGATAQRRGASGTADSVLHMLETERRPYLFGSPRYQAARIVALRGERDRAVALLRQARREGSARIQFFHLERDFESLQDYSPFRDLLQPRPASSR